MAGSTRDRVTDGARRRLRATVGRALVAVALGGGACVAPARELAQQCVYDDQCAAGLVCAGGSCRAACRTDRDCTGGARCAPSGRPDGRACVPPDVPAPCLYASDCTPGQICARDGLCHAQCVTTRDCAVRAPWLVGAQCSGGACVVPSARPRAPLSGALLGGGTATLRWVPPADGAPVRVELCLDAPCANPFQIYEQLPAAAMGGEQQHAFALDATRVWYWRVRSLAAGVPGAPSPWWHVTMGPGNRADYGSLAHPALFANDDAIPDLAVGAPGTNFAVGSVLLFTGGRPALSPTPFAELRVTSGMTIELGASLASVGDLDGNNAGDLLVAAPGEPNLYLFTGTATSLGSSATPATFLPILGTRPLVASVGDINRDGFADFVLGEENGMGGGVVVFSGTVPPARVMVPSVVVRAPRGALGFGAAVAGAGDVNADGYSDVIVGAPSSASGNGAAYAYLGARAGIDSNAPLPLAGDANSRQFGARVAGVGDLDGDGYDEVAVLDKLAMTSAARLWVFRGGPGGLAAGAPALLPLPMATPSAGPGAVVGLGDTNDDGYGDLAVSVDDLAGAGGGRVFVLYGSATGPSLSAMTTLTAPSDSPSVPSHYGAALAAPSSVNGDAFADLAVGAPGNATVYTYYGGAAGIGQTSTIHTGMMGGPSQRFGAAFPR